MTEINVKGAVPAELEPSLKMLKDVIGPMVAEIVEERMARFAESKAHAPVRPANKDVEKPAPGIGAAKCMRYLFLARNDAQKAVELARADGDHYVADVWEKSLSVRKAMGMSTISGGGALLPPQFAQEIIQELGAKAVVRSLGVSSLPMNGSLTLPFIDTAASAYYVSEAANATESTPTTGQLQLSEKTLVALGAFSNQLLSNGGPRVEQELKNHLVRVLARKEDATFIRSAGSSGEPRGMLYWANSSNKFNTAGTTVAYVTSDLGNLMYKLQAQDIDTDSGCGFLLSPRSHKALITARDGNNNLVWAPEMASGRLYGHPFRVTSQIPENLSGSQSEVYFAKFDSLVIAEAEGLEVGVFPDGAYHNGSSVVSGISTYQSVIRAVARHDFGPRFRGKEIAVCQQVAWA